MPKCEDSIGGIPISIFCVLGAENKLNQIAYPITVINGVETPGVIHYNLPLALQTLTCAKDKFDSIIGGQLTVEVKSVLLAIFNTSASATTEVFAIVFGGITILFFLLTLIFFTALYWRDTQYAILALFILALLIIIIVIVIMFLWVDSIYNSSSTLIDGYIQILNDTYTNVQSALLPTFCCFGDVNCGPGVDCPCIIK